MDSRSREGERKRKAASNHFIVIFVISCCYELYSNKKKQNRIHTHTHTHTQPTVIFHATAGMYFRHCCYIQYSNILLPQYCGLQNIHMDITLCSFLVSWWFVFYFLNLFVAPLNLINFDDDIDDDGDDDKYHRVHWCASNNATTNVTPWSHKRRAATTKENGMTMPNFFSFSVYLFPFLIFIVDIIVFFIAHYFVIVPISLSLSGLSV